MKTEEFLKRIIYDSGMIKESGFNPTHVTVNSNWESKFETYIGEQQDEYTCAGLKVCFSESIKDEEIIIGTKNL